MSFAAESVFDVANMAVNGLKVLDEGLPELSTPLTSSSVVLLAYWKSSHSGAVLFLRHSKNENGTMVPAVTRGVFRREGENWEPVNHWSGAGWSDDPVTNPDLVAEHGGRAISESGGSFTVQPNSAATALRASSPFQSSLTGKSS